MEIGVKYINVTSAFEINKQKKRKPIQLKMVWQISCVHCYSNYLMKKKNGSKIQEIYNIDEAKWNIEQNESYT